MAIDPAMTAQEIATAGLIQREQMARVSGDQAAVLNELIRRHRVKEQMRNELERAEKQFNEQWVAAQTMMPDLFAAVIDDTNG